MAWGNRKEEELPESLRGKTHDQIAFELEEGKKLKERLEKLEARDAERDTMFQSFATSNMEVANTLKAINERTTPAPQRTTITETNDPASFITDPDLAFSQRVGPLAAITMQTAAITAKQEAQRGLQRKQSTEKNNIDATLFDKYESEVLELAKNCSAAQLANPATWVHLYYNVKGRHTDEIIANPKSFFTEDATRAPGAVASQDDQLTDQEKNIAAKMGVSPENYLKNKKAASAMPF